ncbi:antA/AntB antirepressor family protein [Vreelandella subglaciescola]|uniref:AntA/AntB antirepressor n=1 Tax=Vreelandella subglaciescola TaxID=29571 RepID=A0A1M7ERA1_9GAMM|nr:antA/AntB antirepressor family protein [Halomonas subglaciescola]SHL94188.1 AntA/AntB antirepressor [Halomonas subglaciescola]
MTNSTAKRNGRSIVTDINHAPKKTLTLTLCFTQEQADRMMKVRRVLPIVEDRQEPQIDARKLWEKIGKPHGRFRDWAEDYIKSLLGNDAEKSARFQGEIEVEESLVGKRKNVKQIDYKLSRDVAAKLAMQANTVEGDEIRQYFLDMEECVLRLSKHQPERVQSLIQLDNAITHHFRSKVGRKAQDGKISKGAVPSEAASREKLLKPALFIRTPNERFTSRGDRDRPAFMSYGR